MEISQLVAACKNEIERNSNSLLLCTKGNMGKEKYKLPFGRKGPKAIPVADIEEGKMLVSLNPIDLLAFLVANLYEVG